MSGTQAVLAIVYLAVLLAGAAIGLVIAVSVASKREDRHRSLAREAPDTTTKGARRLMAMGTKRLAHPEGGPQ
jgi:hypothetical protein